MIDKKNRILHTLCVVFVLKINNQCVVLLRRGDSLPKSSRLRCVDSSSWSVKPVACVITWSTDPKQCRSVLFG